MKDLEKREMQDVNGGFWGKVGAAIAGWLFSEGKSMMNNRDHTKAVVVDAWDAAMEDCGCQNG